MAIWAALVAVVALWFWWLGPVDWAEGAFDPNAGVTGPVDAATTCVPAGFPAIESMALVKTEAVIATNEDGKEIVILRRMYSRGDRAVMTYWLGASILAFVDSDPSSDSMDTITYDTGVAVRRGSQIGVLPDAVQSCQWQRWGDARELL